MANFHVPLPDDLHAELRQAAAELRRPATDLAREWLRRGLDERAREKRREALRAFVDAAAGTELDLDQDLEAAGVELLLGDENG